MSGMQGSAPRVGRSLLAGQLRAGRWSLAWRQCAGLGQRWPGLSLIFLLAIMPLARAADTPATGGKSPQLIIEGLPEQEADNVRRNLSLSGQACDAPMWRITRLFQAADKEVDAALRPFGYYRSTVTKNLASKDACWSAHFTVDPGQRIHWTAVDLRIEGPAASDPGFMRPVARVTPQQGAPLLHADYEAAKAEILLLAASRGYRDGRFTVQQLRVNPALGTAEAVLHYLSGERYRFGELTFDQQAFAPAFVARYARIKPGDPYESAAVARLQRDLVDSGLFSVVEVQPQFAARADGRIPLHIRLEPRKRHAYLAGVGMSTDEGPRLRLGYENRRLNKRGHTGEAALRLSSVRSSFDLGYNIPLNQPRDERLSFLAGYQWEDLNDTQSELLKFGARHSRRRSNGVVQTLFLELSEERFTLGDEARRSRLVMPGVSWDWSRGDDPIYPRRGTRLGLELKGTSRALLSDVDFLQMQLRGKQVLPLGPGRLILRGDFGTSIVGEFDDLPASQRFFAGGDNSVRGYGYRDLGPRSADGTTVGGRHLLAGSVEFDRPVKNGWSVAAFADAGDAFDDAAIKLYRSVGVGVRWRSPVGPIRLDLAHPLDGDGGSIRLHFSLGPDL